MPPKKKVYDTHQLVSDYFVRHVTIVAIFGQCVELHNELLCKFSCELTSAVKPRPLKDDVSPYFEDDVDFFYDTALVQLLQLDADLTLKKAKKQNSSKFSKEWRK